MELLVHSHSCCEVRSQNTSLVCDPWLLGSCYWRSWWNFPEQEDIEKLIKIWNKKDNLFVYITHLHWDHFHGPSIRKIKKYCRNVVFLIPKIPEPRLRKDLQSVLGYNSKILELTHAKKFKLSKELSVLSFQTGLVFADSILSIEADNHHILNMNDAKILPFSLKNLLKKIPKPEYVLRSHSSANDRCCFKDQNGNKLEELFDKKRVEYSKEFFDACYSTGAKFAIPFASNMACLHRDTFQYNSILNFSDYVYNDFASLRKEYSGMECKLILPTEKVLLNQNKIITNRYLRNEINTKSRLKILKDYQDKKSDILGKQYKMEDNTILSNKFFKAYFNLIISRTPYLLKRYLKDYIIFNITSKNVNEYYCINFSLGTIKKLESIKISKNNILVKVSPYVINSVCKQKNYNSLGVSKRLEVLLNYGNPRYFVFNYLCNTIETESFLPLKNIFRFQYLNRWLRRYLEIFDIFIYFYNYFINSKTPFFILQNSKVKE